MFVEDFKRDFYETLHGKPVLIMVNHDVDAVCATRILIYLLEADNIRYSLLSIKNMAEYIKSFNSHCNAVKNIILINFGANFDAFDVVECDEDKSIFIIDNHRPVDVNNIYREQTKLLIDPNSCKNVPNYEELFRESDDEDTDERRKWAMDRHTALFKYNQFSYFDESTAFTLFNYAWKLSKDNYELLWLAMVGVSDLHINAKIDKQKFKQMSDALKGHLSRLKHIQNHAMRKSIEISYTKDLQLVLYRHWTLFESFKHTLYTMCTFQVWNVKGYKRMKEFFAEVGIPLVQCKQKYFAMDLEFRQHSQQWIKDLCKKYKIDDIIGDSFVGSRGFKFKYNSDDVAYGVKAILESPNNEMPHSEKFLKALDALSSKNVDILQDGIDWSRLQFSAIWKQVKASIEMYSVNHTDPFMHAVIQQSAPDAKFFSNPGCLLTLARYILHSFVATKRKRSYSIKPLVLIATDLTQPQYVIAVGIPPFAEKSTSNFFGQ
ncbi:Cell division control protein 45-like protein, partial [Leptotrombidium deliense]